ncbi:hypothetical protein MMC25_000854 [Agyrium rufum]|nr:hypothetical protein [Agyrium rufum]
MPDNTGLYEDSDDDSVSNVFSPTDGYFNGRPPPSHDPVVEDPSQPTPPSAAAAKAREAEEEAHENTEAAAIRRRPQDIVARTPSSQRRFFPDDPEDENDHEPTESSPLISQAPPDYSTAVSLGAAHSRTNTNTNTNTNTSSDSARGTSIETPASPTSLSQHNYGSINDRPAFSSNIPPQNLRDGRNPNDHEQRRSCYSCLWFCIHIPVKIGRVIMFTVLFLIGTAFIMAAIMSIAGSRGGNDDPPWKKLPPNDPQSCPDAYDAVDAYFQYPSPSSFLLKQEHPDEGAWKVSQTKEVHTSGQVHVLPGNVSQPGVLVNVKINVSDKELTEGVRWWRTSDSLHISMPQRVPAEKVNSTHPCIHLLVYITVGPKVSLRDFRVFTEPLAVQFHDGLNFKGEKLEIQTSSGQITFPNDVKNSSLLRTRDMSITSSSGSIAGGFQLWDLLHMSTASGSMHITLEPRDIDYAQKLPARLELKSSSGSIQASMPAIYRETSKYVGPAIPDRDYRTQISTRSGDMKVDLLHGATTELQSASGRIKATLTPYGDVGEKSTIEVSASSGNIDVDVMPSISSPKKPMRKLYSSYRFSSGNVAFAYPDAWEGTLVGRLSSGRVSSNWEDLEIINVGRRDPAVDKGRIDGRKGKGEGVIEFDGASGSVLIKASTGSREHAALPIDRNSQGHNNEEEQPDAPIDLPPQRWPGYSDEWRVSGEVGGTFAQFLKDPEQQELQEV